MVVLFSDGKADFVNFTKEIRRDIFSEIWFLGFYVETFSFLWNIWWHLIDFPTYDFPRCLQNQFQVDVKFSETCVILGAFSPIILGFIVPGYIESSINGMNRFHKNFSVIWKPNNQLPAIYLLHYQCIIQLTDYPGVIATLTVIMVLIIKDPL